MNMTALRRYYLWFFLICFILTLIGGVIAAVLPAGMGGIVTAIPYLVAMIVVLFQFLKREQRAPTQQERKKLTLGFTLIFWGYNFLGVLLGLVIFARQDAEIFQNFLLYLQQPQFISIALIMILLLAIPLYLITYWFYGKQAQRMADKMFQ
ncbi:preprotein translocase subunit YajC [Acinetobacter baylyi]|uniref:Preprotein translocase subunit YajC n=2 Tax=Acinetobacter baylyi TaxID=202950 RepID=A0ABU0UUU4_ACIBI|nr:preprotein translocase subunit YajC [Acinetobacter baylyi]MDR6108080.1 preprotein translocase subunit YajC [Acinetobacter baylyi]MDR6185203.1 preprotein translocase subunit YajC [Acinetobacter baylyi]